MSLNYEYRFPFIACEIFTCEVDIILKTLVEDEEVRGFHQLACFLIQLLKNFTKFQLLKWLSVGVLGS